MQRSAWIVLFCAIDGTLKARSGYNIDNETERSVAVVGGGVADRCS